MAVSRAKLKALSGDKLAELAKTDGLELLYLHLQSMRNFLGLPGRLAVIQGGKSEDPKSDAAVQAEAETRPKVKSKA
jgi:hypothetical protein